MYKMALCEAQLCRRQQLAVALCPHFEDSLEQVTILHIRYLLGPLHLLAPAALCRVHKHVYSVPLPVSNVRPHRLKIRKSPQCSLQEASLALAQCPAGPAEATLPSRCAFLELRPQIGLASCPPKDLLRAYLALQCSPPNLTGRSLQPHSRGHPSGRAHCPRCACRPDRRLQATIRPVTL